MFPTLSPRSPAARLTVVALAASLLGACTSLSSEDLDTDGMHAEIAVEARARMLALTHVSMRSSPKQIKTEAEAIHDNVVVPRDLDLIEFPFRERGEATLVKNGGRPTDQ